MGRNIEWGSTLRRYRNLGVTVLGLLACSACMSHGVAKGKHAQFHGCDEDKVESKDVETDQGERVETTGCGKTETFVCMAAKCRSARILALRHHSNATKCKHEDITTKELSPERFKVEGCGKKAVYKCKEDKKDLISCTKE